MAPPTLQTSSSVLSTSSTNEKAVELAEQKEIEATWKEVQNKVIELAGGDPKKVQTLDINSMLKYVDNIQASDKKKSEKFGAFKSVVNKTLQCINTVGGIVADGASTVSGLVGSNIPIHDLLKVGIGLRPGGDVLQRTYIRHTGVARIRRHI